MLELAILGFLRDQPLHGYDLRTRVAALMGHVRPVADGTLYPAIKRLATAGWLHRKDEPGAAAAPRRMLYLTQEGQEEFERRLRDPADLDISDENRWFTLLAFLRHLNNPKDQANVLRRRLAFLEQPTSFFYDGPPPDGRRGVPRPLPPGPPHHRPRHHPSRTDLAPHHPRHFGLPHQALGTPRYEGSERK
ncbi:PadR family transcriptional regulator [Nonomuraea salmonea]|uniref:PadR family transcriptional regulator n=1 Tax=Nonomuraea salmonea TaxID=46181 RepID=UPI002FEB44AD